MPKWKKFPDYQPKDENFNYYCVIKLTDDCYYMTMRLWYKNANGEYEWCSDTQPYMWLDMKPPVPHLPEGASLWWTY